MRNLGADEKSGGEIILNDRIDTRPYFMLIPTERRLRTHEFVNSFMDMASAFLPWSNPIADESYDKNCLACVDFYNYLATAIIGSLELAGEEAIDSGLQYASCSRVHDAVVSCMKNLRSEIDRWLDGNHNQKKTQNATE